MFSSSSASNGPVDLSALAVRLNSCKPAVRDSSYETDLRNLLTDAYAIVFVGHSGKGYLQPNLLALAMEQEIKSIMQTRRLFPAQLIVVAGGTSEGIGEVYPVAKKMGIETLGIVASQGKEFKSIDCDHLLVVENGNPDDWSTKLPESREELLVTTLRIANSGVGLGGQLLAFNGGRQAYEETLAAARQGFPVKIIADFDPVDVSREQPFKMLPDLEQLQDALAAQHQAGAAQ